MVRIQAWSVFCAVFLFTSFFLFGVVWFHIRVPLGPDIPCTILLYDVLYTWHVLIRRECCCRCYCYSVPLLLQQLLLFVVCRMAKIVAGSLNLIPSSVLFLIQTRFFKYFYSYVPLGSTVAFTASVCLYIIGNYIGNDGHARSEGGRQPVTANPPSYEYSLLSAAMAKTRISVIFRMIRRPHQTRVSPQQSTYY